MKPHVVVALAALLAGPAHARALPDPPVVAVIAHEGGLCQYGPCVTTTTFRVGGRFSRVEGPGKPVEGQVDPALVGALAATIARTDFAAIKARPFTGTCPKAWDGQEDIYVFKTARGEETLRSCKHALDPKHPVLVAARRVEEASRKGR